MDRDASIEFEVDEGEGPPTVRVVMVSADDVDLSMGDALDALDALDEEEGEEVAPGDILETFEASR
jgi:hypothetical protein